MERTPYYTAGGSDQKTARPMLGPSPYQSTQSYSTPYYDQPLPSHAPQAMPTGLQAYYAHNLAPLYPSRATPINQNLLIPDKNIALTTPANPPKRVKIVHTVEPHNGQVLSLYKIGYYLRGERNKSEAPVSSCKLPQAYGKTEDVRRCAKKGCRSCEMTANGYTDLTAALAKTHGFVNITTKKWYKNKGSVIARSHPAAAVPTSVAESDPLRSTVDNYLIIDPVILTKYSAAPHNMPTPPASEMSERQPVQDMSTRGEAPPAARETLEGDQYSVSPPPQRKRKMSCGEYGDHSAKRLRKEITEDPEDHKGEETGFFELQIEDEIPAGFQGMDVGLGHAGGYSYFTPYSTKHTREEDATATPDATPTAGLKFAGFNGMLTDTSEGAWGYDALSAIRGGANNGAEHDMELFDGVNYLRGHTRL
ncbi:hypothetical protein B0A54_11828 [Friedmanniomyces endolithicus]|uniref:Uncharacterized protein n=1 Tax=Friedmanniomyces endolithicus TaxID=329885 RepID=A0A4U0UNX0_9PEZI|nr:hypothetical protein LTS09_008512 [Friedmanniomyces endolithicus]TKA36585.1 hypothetical protein B0A54_11828 [Friedmanniomyces endolithicus]